MPKNIFSQKRDNEGNNDIVISEMGILEILFIAGFAVSAGVISGYIVFDTLFDLSSRFIRK
jgi:hypothetical protein